MNISFLWKFYQYQKNISKSRQSIERLQKKKLQKLLHYAYEHSPYYRRVFEESGITASTLSQTPLKKLPVLDKELLFQYYDEIVTDPQIKQAQIKSFDDNTASHTAKYKGQYHVVHSSGSSGTAQYFLYDDAAWNEMLMGIIRGALWGMNIWEIYELLKQKPRILYIAATDGRYGGAMAVGDGISDLGALEETLDINLPMEKWTDKVTAFSPNIIIGYPSAIKLLAEQMKKENASCQLQRIIACGEPLAPGLRIFLEQHFDCTVINFYGASESLALGLEEKQDTGMALFDDLNIIEVENGEMYVTCLYNYAQPLIRYHLTDRLELQPDTAAQKQGFTRANLLLCRNEDVMWFAKKDGGMEFLHPLSIEGLCVEGLVDYQFVQTSEQSFEISVEAMPDAGRDSLAAGIQKLIRPLLESKALSHVRYTIKFVDSIWMEPDTGKKKLVVTMKDFAQSSCTEMEAII